MTFSRLPDHPFDVKVVCNRSITTIDYQSEGLTNQCIFLPKFIPGGHFVPWALRGRSSPIVLTLYVLQRSKSSAFQLNSAFLTGSGIKFWISKILFLTLFTLLKCSGSCCYCISMFDNSFSMLRSISSLKQIIFFLARAISAFLANLRFDLWSQAA